MLTLLDFMGDWRVLRRVDDRRAGQHGLFEGTARIVAEGQGARYREEGTLRLGGGPPLAASRDYLWLPDGDGIAVRFADGGFFHRFTPLGRAPGTDHACGQDLYRVTYDVAAWPAWTAEWAVTGPAKNYVMATRYARR